jgi:UDP-N-acetylglucosamine--N-acetylmuramyl-(pentapeptide) pyrophosphoryl-undecaprenol N-acetylglucosamine transferase
MARPPHILIAGGGTGGHVYPAIAIADAIQAARPEARVIFAGTEDRLEARAVPEAGYALHPITVRGFQRSLSAENLAFPVKLAQGLWESWKLVGAIDPDVAVGTGGYVAGPVLFAAWMRGRPLLIQEQNAYAGVTNRLLGLVASRIHAAFPEAEDDLPSGRTTITGNPVRRSLTETSPDAARRALGLPADARVLLVFGGSLGSKALNDVLETHLPEILDAGGETDRPVHVIWQTGSRYFDDLVDRLAGTALDDHPRLQVREYIDRMDWAYAAADLALCRAGALTSSELLVTGTPSILVPSPNVVADHQTKNARSMERTGAARMLPEADLDDRFVPMVRDLLLDDATRAEMAGAARAAAQPDAAERIAADVLALANAHRPT